MNSQMRRTTKETGAVSIFIVIFTALLVTTIVVSFVSLMIRGQQQATTSDLSASAYDSAQAGVEDAKRALVTYRNNCQGSGAATSSTECINLAQALNDGNRCDTIQRSGISGSITDKEVLIKQTEGDSSLQQAYTCVKVKMNTTEYVGNLAADGSRVIPLRSTNAFNKIAIEWYSQVDLSQSSTGSEAKQVNLETTADLPALADWPADRPALMRAQLIQFGGNFKLSDFDKVTNGTSTESNAHTLFLMPSKIGRNEGFSFADDSRLSSTTANVLQQVSCDEDFSTTSTDRQYACSATIDIPSAVGETGTNRVAYLRLSTLYNTKTSFSVKLSDGTSATAATPVTFSGVQPVVDSTGRANDLFRRVQSRVEIDNSSFPYPQSSVELTGNLCKDFLVTDTEYATGTCTP